MLACPGPDFLGSGGDSGALDGFALVGEDLCVVHVGGHDLDECVVVVVVEVEVAAFAVDPYELDAVSACVDGCAVEVVYEFGDVFDCHCGFLSLCWFLL